MKLLHILSQRPGRSGSGVFLKAMVRQAARRGYPQYVIAAGPPGTCAAEVPPVGEDNFSAVIFPSPQAPFDVPGNSDVMPYPSTVFSEMTPPQVGQYLAAARQTFEQVREVFQPDIIHTHHLWLMSALAREVFKDIPIVATSHNVCLRLSHTAPHLAEKVFPLARQLDTVALLTPQSKIDIMRVYGIAEERISIPGSGYDDSLFFPPTQSHESIIAQLEREHHVDLRESCKHRKIVTYIGRLSPAKGIPYLLQAVEQLKLENRLDFKLVLIGATGSGAEGERMAELVAPLRDEVIHTGALPQEAINLILQASDLFVLPSLFEGLPLVLLEALGTSTPCLVSELPTIASWVPETWVNRGLVRYIPKLQTTGADTPVAVDEPRFVQAIAQGLTASLAQPPAKEDLAWMAEEIRQHTWSNVFDRYASIYSAISLKL